MTLTVDTALTLGVFPAGFAVETGVVFLPYRDRRLCAHTRLLQLVATLGGIQTPREQVKPGHHSLLGYGKLIRRAEELIRRQSNVH